MFFPTSNAIADPRECPANHTLAPLDKPTVYWTYCIASWKRELWWSVLRMHWRSNLKSCDLVSDLVIVPRKAMTYCGIFGVGDGYLYSKMAPNMDESTSSMSTWFNLKWKKSHQGRASAWDPCRFCCRSNSRMYTPLTKLAAIDLRWCMLFLQGDCNNTKISTEVYLFISIISRTEATYQLVRRNKLHWTITNTKIRVYYQVTSSIHTIYISINCGHL